MYYETERKKVRVTPIGGTEIEMQYRQRTYHLNYKEMETALPPNFVHSLDASHLMMTVLKCKKAGIDSFGMVHDSYASHAANIPLMLKLLKEAFVELHKRDVLAEFSDQIAAGIEEWEEVEEEHAIDWGGGMTSTLPTRTEPVEGEEYLQDIERKALEKYLKDLKKKAPERYLRESKRKHLLERGNLDIEEVLESTYFFA